MHSSVVTVVVESSELGKDSTRKCVIQTWLVIVETLDCVSSNTFLDELNLKGHKVRVLSI